MLVKQKLDSSRRILNQKDQEITQIKQTIEKTSKQIEKTIKDISQQKVHLKNSEKSMFNKLRNMENGICKNRNQFFKSIIRREGQYSGIQISNDIPSKTEVWSYKVYIKYYLLFNYQLFIYHLFMFNIYFKYLLLLLYFVQFNFNTLSEGYKQIVRPDYLIQYAQLLDENKIILNTLENLQNEVDVFFCFLYFFLIRM